MKRGYAESALRLYFRAVGEPDKAQAFRVKSVPAPKEDSEQ